MAVVEVVEHLAVEDVLEQFEVDDESGDGIDFAGDGDFEGVVVAMAVEIGALAEDALIFLGRPVRVVVIVGGGELGLASEIDHSMRSRAMRKK